MIIEAKEIKTGTQIAERDGFLWTVSKINKETDKTITVTLFSDFSSFKSHHSDSGIQKTFRKSTKLHVIQN